MSPSDNGEGAFENATFGPLNHSQKIKYFMLQRVTLLP